MSIECKKILNPLLRDGTSQNQRLVRALHPSYVEVDEKKMEDLLLYAKEYAGLIRYYSTENKADGDWRIFIECDISTLVAIIAKEDLPGRKKEFDQMEQLSDMLQSVYNLAFLAEEWLYNSIEGLQLHLAMEKLLNSILNDSLRKTIAYAKSAEAVTFPSGSGLVNSTVFRSDIWSLEGIEPDPLFLPSGTPVQIDELQVGKDKVKKEFHKFYNGLLSIQKQAPGFLEETLESYPQHQPHMALFLAFLQIFKIAQQHLNTFTRRHLNFYYQEVLQLKPLPPKPDEVHTIFQLAKGLDKHLVKAKTELKAKQKDDNGANLFFATDNDLLVNKTQLDEVDGLKTIFIEKNYDEPFPPEMPEWQRAYPVLNIYGAPIANSADGNGAELTDEEGKWFTLGDKSTPPAKLGFAVASPMFLMKEGGRTITLSFHFDPDDGFDWVTKFGYDDSNANGNNDGTNAVAHEIRHNITPYYSGEKGWVQTQITRVELEENLTAGEPPLIMHLTIGLKAGEEPILPYDPEVIKDGLNTTFPVLKFILDNDGLKAQGLCGNLPELDDKNDADLLIPEKYRIRMLRLLNEAKTWIDIAAVEPQVGPVIDNPFVNTANGYDIGENVANEIIKLRNCLPDQEFKKLTDLFDPCNDGTETYEVTGFGEDKMMDLYYTACLQDSISHIKANVRIYAADPSGSTNYPQETYVLHQNEYYKAATSPQSQKPHPDASDWLYVPKSYPYQYFRRINLHHLQIEVIGANMQDLILENDVGVINPAKPFLPFGPLPKKGSRFYIGSHEVFQKRLTAPDDSDDNLILEINWADLPKISFDSHYLKYDEPDPGISNNNHFKTSIDLLKNNAWRSIPSDETLPFQHSLFADGTDAPGEVLKYELQDLPSDRTPFLQAFSNYNVTLKQGFLKLELKTSFLHKQYIKEVTNAALREADTEIPNEPYTPTINSLKLSYRSVETINYKDLRFKDRVERLFHLEPFGWKEFFPFDNDVDAKAAVIERKILPLFTVTEKKDKNNEFPKPDAEGNLYIGLKDLEPPQSVSILFQMAEGSSDPDLDKQEVVWSYLLNNRWIDFKSSEILSDGTNGLLTSGIITFAIPREISNTNTSLKKGLYWIKASVAIHTRAISKAIAVMPQAVKATFLLQKNNDPNRLKDSLPKESISKLKERQAAIKKIVQPFASFDGKVEEQVEAQEGVEGDDRFKKEYNEFYIRISERLRHKNRGVTIFDYERLVLQQFPDIYKVKCINHTRLDKECIHSPEHAPGYVKVIVLPNLRNKNAVNPYEPKVSLNRLDEVKKFLQPLICGFVRLEVKNPIFEKVQVNFKVKFYAFQEANRGYYETKLNEDIKQFLSPWLYDEGQDLVLGGKVHRSLILNYIEERDYVDYITDFSMDHIIEKSDDTIQILPDVEEAVAQSSSSVIVTADEHKIENDIQIACQIPSS